MPTITESTIISGVQIVEPSMFKDDRGYFIETYRRQWFPLGREMVQGNRGDRQAPTQLAITGEGCDPWRNAPDYSRNHLPEARPFRKSFRSVYI